MTQDTAFLLEDPVTQSYELAEEIERRRRDGSLIPMKADMMIEMLVLPHVVAMIQDPELSAGQKLLYMNWLTDISGVKQRQRATAAPAGVGFSIIINPPAPAGQQSSTTIDGRLVDITPPRQRGLPDPEPDVPPMPPGFRVPDFKLTNDLVGVTPFGAGAAPLPDPRRTV